MPIRRTKIFETPEGCRQSQITEYFKNTGVSINRRLFGDDSIRTAMYKNSFYNNNQSDEFVESTPKRKINLPFPLISDDEESVVSVDISKSDVNAIKRSNGGGNSIKVPENNAKANSKIFKKRNISNKTMTSEKSKKCLDENYASSSSNENFEGKIKSNDLVSKPDDMEGIPSSIRNIGTPKKSHKTSFDEDSSNTESDQTPSKKIKISSTAEYGNLNINVHINIPSVSTLDTPKSSKINSILGTPSKKTSTPPKSPSQKNNMTAKNSPKKKNSPVKTKVGDTPKLNEDAKLNFKQMELLKKIFMETLKDTAKRALLTTVDISFIEEFLKMDENYQYFLMKLFIYQPSWYNMLKFCKMIKLDEKLFPKDIIKMYEYHKNNFYVDTDISVLSTNELLNMLLIEDLKQIVKDLNLKLDQKKRKKGDIIELLCKNTKTQSTLTTKKSSADILRDVALKYLGYCIRLKDDARSSFHKAYILQTYCNSSYYTDIQNFFKDMGHLVVTYPNYNVENFTPFKTKEQFSRFYEAVTKKIELGIALEKKDIVAVKQICDLAFEKLRNIDDDSKWRTYLPGFLHKFSAEYVYISILKNSIKQLNKNFEDVKIWLEYLIENYPKNQAVGFWYKHLAHIMAQYYKNYETAAEIVIKAYKFNKEDNLFDFLQLFELNKLANKLIRTKSYKLCNLYCDQLVALSDSPVDTENFPKKVIKACTDRRETPGKRIYSFRDANNEVSYGHVEMIALKYYKSNEHYEGLHCEGRLVVLLFALLFWDIIYDYYVPNTFISELQNAPLDMYSHAFYENRKDEIEFRLQEIASEWSVEKLEQTLRDNWNNHSHEKSIVDFENLEKDIESILKIFRCFNRTVLSKVLGRLATNYRRFRGGLPDLFLWNSEQSKCKFVEVKGEKDKLQPNQILWIQYLLEVGAVVEVCHVSGVGGRDNLLNDEKNTLLHKEKKTD